MGRSGFGLSTPTHSTQERSRNGFLLLDQFQRNQLPLSANIEQSVAHHGSGPAWILQFRYFVLRHLFVLLWVDFEERQIAILRQTEEVAIHECEAASLRALLPPFQIASCQVDAPQIHILGVSPA